MGPAWQVEQVHVRWRLRKPASPNDLNMEPQAIWRLYGGVVNFLANSLSRTLALTVFMTSVPSKWNLRCRP
jgi:uncharacterized membrane protein